MFSRWILTNITSARGTLHSRKIHIPCGYQLVICGLYVWDKWKGNEVFLAVLLSSARPREFHVCHGVNYTCNSTVVLLLAFGKSLLESYFQMSWPGFAYSLMFLRLRNFMTCFCDRPTTPVKMPRTCFAFNAITTTAAHTDSIPVLPQR
jgi:hypothetical protein